MLLSEFFEKHFANVYLARCKRSTVDLYRQILKFWLDKIGDSEIEEISLENCSDFVTAALDYVRPETVAKYCRHMNTIFLKMSKPGYRNREAFGFVENPPYCKPPRLMQRLPKEVSDRQLIKHIDALSDNRDFPRCVDEHLRPKWWKAFCLFAATTALRREVIFSVKWDAFDLQRNVFYVSPEIDKTNNERLKYLHPNLVRLLLEIRTRDARVFNWTHGYKKFYECWSTACEATGNKIKLHDLKRYASQLALRSGADVATLKEFCDHSNINTTLKHYARGNVEALVHTLKLPDDVWHD